MISLSANHSTDPRATCAVGASADPDTGAAARAAVETALGGLDGARPDLVLVYASVRHELSTVLAIVNAATGGVPLAGASTSGQLEGGRLTGPGDGISVLAIAGGGYRFGVGHATGVSTDADEAGRRLARAARLAAGPERSPHEALIVFSDGLAGDQQSLLNGIHRVTGFAIPVIGGAAGDDRHLMRTFVFSGDEVITDAAVGVWVGSPRPLRVVSAHGWHPTSLPLMLSDVDGRVIRELGSRPALEVYREHFRHDDPRREIDEYRDGGYHSAHAFGLIQPDGSLLIRGAFIDDNGELISFSPMPPYSAVQVVACSADDLLEVGEQVVAEAVEDLDASVVLVFDCVARLDILAERGPEETKRLQSAAGTAPTFGFYTYGEFARTDNVAGYHNATIAAMAL